jgi:L-iditol 2-dehydrogenase
VAPEDEEVHMKALVKYEKGIGMMEIREMPVPEPDYGEVLIKVEFCGICGTDIKIYDDEFVSYPPVIVGHEFSGRIAKLGEGVKGWKLGDKVVSEQHTKACGRCCYCHTGKRHFCAEKRSPGYGVNGAFAEYIKVPASLLHSIPGEISFEEAALIEPIAIAAYGILDKTRIEPEDKVVILGSGSIAILALQMIKAEGASRFIMTGLDMDEKVRFHIAEKLGADVLINVQKEDPVEIVMKLTDGIGVDVVVDLSGSPMAILQGFDMLKKDGRFCAIGLTHHEVAIPWMKLAMKAANIHFSFSSNHLSWQRCLSMIKNGKVKLEQYTKDIYPLGKWEEAFQKARSGESLKVIIQCN